MECADLQCTQKKRSSSEAEGNNMTDKELQLQAGAQHAQHEGDSAAKGFMEIVKDPSLHKQAPGYDQCHMIVEEEELLLQRTWQQRLGQQEQQGKRVEHLQLQVQELQESQKLREQQRKVSLLRHRVRMNAQGEAEQSQHTVMALHQELRDERNKRTKVEQQLADTQTTLAALQQKEEQQANMAKVYLEQRRSEARHRLQVEHDSRKQLLEAERAGWEQLKAEYERKVLLLKEEHDKREKQLKMSEQLLKVEGALVIELQTKLLEERAAHEVTKLEIMRVTTHLQQLQAIVQAEG